MAKHANRRVKAGLSIILVALFAGASLAPLATASHRHLYGDPVYYQTGQAGTGVNDEGQAVTTEPDFKTTEYWTPGTAVENCIADLDPDMNLDGNAPYVGGCDPGVTAADILADDNTLFLDAQIMHQTAVVVWANHQFYWHLTGQQSDVIFPGPNGFMGWFGHWNDKNQDGRIDDVCKWETDPARVATDEFIWRGQSSGENGGTWQSPAAPFKFVMYTWIDPGTYRNVQQQPVASMVPFNFNRTQPAPDDQPLDRTSSDGAKVDCPNNQGWFQATGFPIMMEGSGLIHDLTQVTAVNPERLTPGDPRVVDMTNAPFVDVDKYTALNPLLNDLLLQLNDAARTVCIPTQSTNPCGPSTVGNATTAAVTTANDTANAGIAFANATLIATCASLETETGKDVCDPESTACEAAEGAGVEACAEGDPSDPVCALVRDQSGVDACAIDPVAVANAARNGAYSDIYGAAGSRLTRIQVPPQPHEPNTPFDVYSCADAEVASTCNATYGGTSYAAGGTDGFPVCLTDSTDQPRGTCNSYAGYQSGWHAWVDSVPQNYFPQSMKPYGAPAGIVGGGFAFPGITPGVYTTSAGHGKYSDVSFAVGYNYHWAANVGQWHDKNLDTWVRAGYFSDTNPNGNGGPSSSAPYGTGTAVILAGSVDPTSEGGDFYFQQGGNNYTAWSSPNNLMGEWIALCGLQNRVLETGIKLVPMTNGVMDPEAGSWGKGVIVRWEHLEPGKPSGSSNPGHTYFDLYTQGEIVLNDSCLATTARDAVAFLGANYDGIEFAVVSYARINVDTDPLSSEDVWVPEIVIDVDIHTVTR
ncbi:MAG: hypothetical protein HY556_11030 [Euryarchaeota archaeon]|nr:hypothetical protein [Euryarchaeota archaeon]